MTTPEGGKRVKSSLPELFLHPLLSPLVLRTGYSVFFTGNPGFSPVTRRDLVNFQRVNSWASRLNRFSRISLQRKVRRELLPDPAFRRSPAKGRLACT